VLNTLKILPRSFGVHFSHDAIPLDFGLVSEQFTKEVISETCKHAFHNLGVDKPYFCSLDFGESFWLCWVFLPGLSFCKLVHGCSRAQSNLCGRFEIFSYPFFSMNRKKDMRCFTNSSPFAPSPKRVCLDSPLGVLILTVSCKVLTSRPFLDTAYRMGGC
jgi:hypothetical protein